jgi:AraC-like DNA-binding protein
LSDTLQSASLRTDKGLPLGATVPRQDPIDSHRVSEGSWSARIKTENIDDWSGALFDTYGALDVVPDRDSPFSASLSRREFDRLKMVSLRGTPQSFHRTTPMITSDSSDELFVTMLVKGSGMVIQDGRTASLEAGEFTLVESSRPYTTVFREPARIIDFTWRRENISLSEAESFEATARTITSDAPMGRLLSPLLLELYRVGGDMSGSGAIRLSTGIADLVVTAALELGQPNSADQLSRRQFDDIVRFIENNLVNPDLTTELIADTFYISQRTLHRVFARHGRTVAAVIREMRLEACRNMMVSQVDHGTSISIIASRFCFSSLQAFSRVFAAHYGTPPKVYRDLHR